MSVSFTALASECWQGTNLLEISIRRFEHHCCSLKLESHLHKLLRFGSVLPTAHTPASATSSTTKSAAAAVAVAAARAEDAAAANWENGANPIIRDSRKICLLCADSLEYRIQVGPSC